MSFRITNTLRTARSVTLRPVAGSQSMRVAALHSSRVLRASAAPEDPMADPKFQNFYEKIRNHQGAVDAMMKVAEVMKSKGLDTTKTPSKMEMVKLSFDADLRDAATNLMTQLKEAGVELDAQTMQEMFTKMK